MEWKEKGSKKRKQLKQVCLIMMETGKSKFIVSIEVTERSTIS